MFEMLHKHLQQILWYNKLRSAILVQTLKKIYIHRAYCRLRKMFRHRYFIYKGIQLCISIDFTFSDNSNSRDQNQTWNSVSLSECE